MGGWPGSTSALMALVWSGTQVGHRLWQGVYMSNTREGAEVSCVQSQERWSPGPSVWCTGWEGAPVHLPAPKNRCIHMYGDIEYRAIYIHLYRNRLPRATKWSHYTKTLKWQGAPLPESLGPWGWHHGERGSLTGKGGEKEGVSPWASPA